MLEYLKKEVSKHGDRLTAIPAERLKDVKMDFDMYNIDTTPYYNFEAPKDLGFTVRSVLAVASPDLPAIVSFNSDAEEKNFIIPPSYVDSDEKVVVIENYLQNLLRDKGFRVTRAKGLPCKPIAAHSGLGTYGRNNIIYADNMGSFISISLFFSDMPCDYECFYPLRFMDCCEGCNRCVENCPTAALTYESSLVNADRCLTMLNENTGDFPGWLKPEWHNALVGCIKCQYACPQNKEYINNGKVIASYNREQTNAFITGELPEEMLTPLGLKYYNKVLPRNLKVLLNL